MHPTVPLLLVLALIAAGCGGDGKDDVAETTQATTATQPPPPPEERRTTVTLLPVRATVRDGRSLRLTGLVDDESIREVRLYAGSAPGDATFVRHVAVRSGGRFRTRVRPRRTTRYWARVAGAAPGESAAARVAVGLVPRIDIQEQGAGTGRAVVTWRARNAALRRRPGGRSCLYTRPKGRKAWRRVRCASARRDGRRLVATFRITGAQNGDTFTQCARTDVARGFVDARVAGCGRKRIRRMRAAAA